MKKNFFFIAISGIIAYGVLFTGITNGQVDNSTYTSRSCKVYKIEYSDNLQAYTSPDLKKQEYFINTDYFKRYIDSKNKQVPNCPANGGENLNSYSDTSSNQNRFTAPNGKIYFISQKGGEYTADGLNNQKTFKTIDELKNYIKIRNPLAILNQNINSQGTQETYGESSNSQQHGSADNQNSQNQDTSNQYNQDTSNQYNQDTSNQYNQNTQTENSSTTTYTTQLANCSGLPENAYRINSKFTQTYYGTIGLPTSKSATYSTDSSVDCAFLCYSDFTRNSYNNTCEKSSNNEDNELLETLKRIIDGTDEKDTEDKKGETRLKECTGLPDNAKWINGEFKQTWNGSSRKPKKVDPEYSSDDEIECSFKCKSNYKRNSRTEECEKKSSGGGGGGGGGGGSSTSYSCQGALPNNTSLNNPNAIPSSNINYFFSETSTSACAFKCNSNYTWNSKSQTCEQTIILICTGLPENAKRINSRFKLIWDGSSRIQNTTKNTCTNDSSSSLECSFTCNNNYKCNSDNSGCIPSSTPICKNLPDNATPNNDVIPNVDTDYTFDTITNKICTFHCNTNYIWDSDSKSCIKSGGGTLEDSSYSCQGTLPEHASLNNSNAKPDSNIDYFYDESSSAACAFKCDTSYTRTPSSQTCNANAQIVNCTGTLPEHAIRINNKFSQTRNGTDWTPPYIENIFTGNNNIECSFICENNYSWNSNSKTCNSNGQDSSSYSCQGTLPEHASLNNSNAKPDSNIDYFYDESSSAACAFKCNNNYTRTPSSQTCDKIGGGDGQGSSSYSCQGSLPENAHANNNKTPSENINYYYNDTDTTEPCTFQCNEHFKRNKTACVLETQKAKCTGNPDNTRRIVDEFTQTWDISNGRRTPLPGEKEKTYNEAEDNNIECSFACLDNEHFTRKPEINKCEANTRKVSCEGNNTDNKQIPNHSSWINSEFTQTWNGSEWSPKKHAYYRSDSYESDECTFSCDNYYEQDKANYQCKPTCIGAEYIRSHATEKKGPGSESSEINVYNSEDEQENTERPNCSYTCNNNEGYYKKGNDCVKYTCTNIPEYAELIKDSDTELKNDDDATSKLCDENGKYNGEECSGNKVKCAYKCDEYHKYENGTCIYKTVVNDRIYLCGAGAIDYSIPLQRTNGLEDVQNLIKDIKLETYAGNDVTEVAYGGIPQENNDNLCESNAQVHDNEAEVSNDEKRWEWDCELKADTRVRTHCFARKLHGQCGGAANECDYDNCFKECKYNCNGNKNCAGACVEKCNCNNDNLCNNDSRKVFGNNSSWDCGYEAGQTIGGRVSCTAKDVGTLGNTYCGVATGYTYAGLAYPDNEDEFKLCQNGSDLVIDNGAYITRDYGNEQLNRYCETNNNSYKCSANMFQASCGDASTNTEGYIKIDKDTQNLCKNDRGNPIDITDTGLEWRWTCKIDYSNDNDSSTFGTDTETCTAKRGGCNNEPTNTNGLNKSTDNYIGDIRETREYVEPSTFNENDVCKWTCKSGYTKDGNTCVPNSNGTNSNVNESSKNGTW